MVWPVPRPAAIIHRRPGLPATLTISWGSASTVVGPAWEGQPGEPGQRDEAALDVQVRVDVPGRHGQPAGIHDLGRLPRIDTPGASTAAIVSPLTATSDANVSPVNTDTTPPPRISRSYSAAAASALLLARS